MDLEHLTKTQIVLLGLLISFVTSMATAIFTVSLVNQSPPPITNTINRVVERIVDPMGLKEEEEKEEKNQQPTFISKEDAIVKVVKDVSPAVVSVVATKDLPVVEQYYINPFGNDPLLNGFDIKIPQYRQNGTEKKEVSSGTGFFIGADGTLITNKHVVEDKDAQYSIIMNDGRKLDAKVLTRDPFQDLAILKVEGANFPVAKLGDSSKLNIGQTVVAIGNTLGEFSNTVSIGIISGLNRKITAQGGLSGPEELTALIQTDAAINHGNSGGPLLNINGEVIGINTAIAESAQSVGFALLINIAKRDIQDVKDFGSVQYPYAGIRYVAIDAKIKTDLKLSVDYGLLIKKGDTGEPAVVVGGPAEKAGIKEGDIILEINGTKINQENTLTNILVKYRVGDKLNIKILREGKESEVSLVLEKRPDGV